MVKFQLFCLKMGQKMEKKSFNVIYFHIFIPVNQILFL